MLLTTESVLTQQDAITVLRWYTYRWRVEEYHKILKSGCKAESYRLSCESMSAMLGFLTVIAAQLLRMTYLHRTSPHLPATEVLTKTQIDVLIASSSPKQKKEITSFTIDWAIRAIARLGGYLEHRKNVSQRTSRTRKTNCIGNGLHCSIWMLHSSLSCKRKKRLLLVL